MGITLGTRRDTPSNKHDHPIKRSTRALDNESTTDCWRLLDESIGTRPSDIKVPYVCSPMSSNLINADPLAFGHDSVAHRGKPRLHDHMVPGSIPPGAHPSGRVRTAVSRLRGKANPCAWFQVQVPSDASLDLAVRPWCQISLEPTNAVDKVQASNSLTFMYPHW